MMHNCGIIYVLGASEAPCCTHSTSFSTTNLLTARAHRDTLSRRWTLIRVRQHLRQLDWTYQRLAALRWWGQAAQQQTSWWGEVASCSCHVSSNQQVRNLLTLPIGSWLPMANNGA